MSRPVRRLMSDLREAQVTEAGSSLRVPTCSSSPSLKAMSSMRGTMYASMGVMEARPRPLSRPERSSMCARHSAIACGGVCSVSRLCKHSTWVLDDGLDTRGVVCATGVSARGAGRMIRH